MSAALNLKPGDAMPKIEGMLPNPGKLPPEAIGKRVEVELCNGIIGKGDWAADGQNGCRWTLTGNGWDIAFYQVVS